MNEIEVVIDVRQSPHSAELIVVKQKLAVEGAVRLVGGPVEKRIDETSIGVLDESGRVKVNSAARMKLDTLCASERLEVVQAIEALPVNPGRWPKKKVKLLATNDTPTYLLHVSPELRAFIGPADNGQIELFDIVHRDTLKLFQDEEDLAGL